MKIVIVGCGKVGRQLAGQLCEENHEVTVIDMKESSLEDVTNKYDVMGIVGNGALYNVQQEADIENADIFISVTNSDELNILCCLIARKAAKCKTIARVRNPEYSKEIEFIREEMGLSLIINPEKLAAHQISKILHCPSATEIDEFSEGNVELIEYYIEENSRLNGMSIKELSERISEDVVVCAVKQGKTINIPDGSFVLNSDDRISLITTPEGAKTFFKKLGEKSSQVNDTIIAGASRISYYLAQELLDNHIDVKIIEVNKEKCEQIKELLPKAVVICGDASDEELLQEEGIEKCESFVSLTNFDESNVFLSLYVRENAPKSKVVTKINRMSFNNIIDTIDIGSIVDPKKLTADDITRFVRAVDKSSGVNIETLFKISKSNLEALEFIVDKDSSLVGKAIKDIKLKKDLIIPCISRNKNMIIANGKTIFEANDKVIVITTNKHINDLEDIVK